MTTRTAATLRAWHLALLRFLITREETDRTVALAAASELDRSSARASHGDLPNSDFHFFQRTCIGICVLIADPRHPDRETRLRAHVDQISDPVLKRAFMAALDLKPATSKRAARLPARPTDLWKGLPMTAPHLGLSRRST